MAGFGGYKHVDLIEWQRQVHAFRLELFPEVKNLDKFPGYYNWWGWSEFKISRHSFGFDYSYLYTGGRIYLADYSGLYSMDLLLNSRRYASYYKYWIFDDNFGSPFMLYSQIRMGKGFSLLKLNQTLEVYNIDKLTTEEEFESNGTFYEIGLGLVYRINRYFDFILSTGYEFDVPQELASKEDNNIYLTDKYRNHMKTNWSGMRLRVGIGFTLKKNNPKHIPLQGKPGLSY